MPLITKATRLTDHTSTLIDHMYTKVLHKAIKAGICLADVSDHLPIFVTTAKHTHYEKTLKSSSK